MNEISLSYDEEALLCNFEDDIQALELPLHIRNIWDGQWTELIKKGIDTYVVPSKLEAKKFEELLERNNDNFEEIFCIGLSCFLTFIQSNFTGPPLNSELTDFLQNQKIVDAAKFLHIDGEECDVNVVHAELLITAKYIFTYCKLENEYIKSWWSLRCLMIHQSLLDDCTITLYNEIEKSTTFLLSWNLSNVRLKAKLLTEIAQIFLMYGKINETELHLKHAREILGVELQLAGELGRRTKYQQKDLAQIKLNVTLNGDVSRPVLADCTAPEIIKLDDDVRLDKVQFNTGNDITTVLPATEQSIILATVQFMQRSRPRDELLLEESDAFYSFLLQQNNSWPLRVVCLLLRSRLESNHKRTVERSLTQCESIVDHLWKEEPSILVRLSIFWNIAFPPKWKIEAQMADLMLNLGLVKAALEVFLKLQLWEEVIVCYTLLNLRHKAAEIIKEQLSSNPSVKLWCLLGDATDDISCYEKAWELSAHRSSRAQRHWGQFYFSHKQYEESIPHLQKSLEINSLQNMVLLRLGYAALSVDDWRLAANTYRKYTSLEPGSFEAWNNLAKAYVKLGEKSRAHFALQEALKYSFDNWRVWDNFMVVSAGTLNLEDVIRSYHHILDIKEKHLDVDVLHILVKEILLDTEGKYVANKLKTKTLELFGRLTSIYPGESKLWEMYSDLSPTPGLKAQRLYRAYRGLVQDDWSKDPAKCGKVLEICYRLGETALIADAASISSARLTLRAAVAAAKKHSWEQNVDILKSVEDILETIVTSVNLKPNN